MRQERNMSQMQEQGKAPEGEIGNHSKNNSE